MAEIRTAIAEPVASPSSAERAIDLVHLARMTFGDRRLEREVLELFDRQAEMLISRIPCVAPPAAAALAHTLKGSAHGIGAHRVARAAERLEAATADGEAEMKSALAALEAATMEARGVIADLLRSY
jgi:HPt (histidine-containing phosphotransfer) domain-containing protein